MKKRATQSAFVPALAAEGVTSDEHPFIHMASGEEPPRRRVTGQRRRPGSDRPSSGRAEAPRRDNRPPSGSGHSQPTGGGFNQPTGGGYSGGGGMGGFPGGMRGAAGGGSVLLLLCAAIAYFLFGGGLGGGGGDILDTGQGPQNDTGQNSQSSQVEDLGSLADEVSGGGLPTVAPLGQQQSTTFQGSGGLNAAANSGEVTGAAAASLPAAANSTVTDGQTWTILLYQDADDKVLEQDIFIDFNEAERVGSTDRVKIVAQMTATRAALAPTATGPTRAAICCRRTTISTASPRPTSPSARSICPTRRRWWISSTGASRRSRPTNMC